MARALRVTRLILMVATVALCLLLCWQAIDLYFTGNRPENFSAPGVRIEPVYSREIVASRLGSIAPALWGYLVLVVAGLTLQALAGEQPRLRPISQTENRLLSLRSRTAEIPPEALAEQRRRRITRILAGAVILACAVPCGIYLLNGKNFASLELESVVGQMLLHVAPWVALALIAAAVATVLNGKSMLREIEILKPAPRKAPEAAAPAVRKWTIPTLRVALYVTAVVFIVLGVLNGGLWDVLVKAVNICTECIGLG